MAKANDNKKKKTIKDKFIGTIIVANNEDVDIYKIHVYEKSIRFDKEIAQAINADDKLRKEIVKMNVLWQNCEFNMRNDFFAELTTLLTLHEDVISDCFLKPWQLNENGHIKEDGDINYDQEISYEEGQPYLYYNYLKSNKKLESIKRKDFEKNIKNEEIVNFYIDNYSKRKARFYKYKPDQSKDEMFYFMVVGNAIKIGMSV
jgi:hypothetical protein